VCPLFLCVLVCLFPSFTDVSGPGPLKVDGIGGAFLNNAAIQGYFADILRQGGFGHWKTERAAFLVRDEDGRYRCIAWPMDGHLYRQEFHGAIPDHTVAIVHTHPSELPLGSPDDERTAIKLSMPVFVLTPMNINMIDGTGKSVPIVQNRLWATSGGSSSTRCGAPASTTQKVARAATSG
jgi:hypothetical protein